jgi:hypothetical protein
MSCPYIDTCPTFVSVMLDESKAYLAWAFCRTIHSDCGRYKMVRSGDRVPEGLMPDGEIASPAEVSQPLRRMR